MAHPLFLHPFREKTWCSSQIISSTRLGVSLYHLATVETHWQFPELKNPTSTKTTPKILTKTWWPSQKTKGSVHCAPSFLSTWGFSKFSKRKLLLFRRVFFEKTPGASLEAPKCCTSRNRRSSRMTWLGVDVLGWNSHVLCLNVFKNILEMKKSMISSWWFQPNWNILVKFDHFPR